MAGRRDTEQISRAGKLMDALNLLPAPWPLEDLLDSRDFQHVKRLYGIGGLSYGNISSRKDATPVLDERERRQQDPTARDRPRHPARQGLRLRRAR